MLNCLIGVADIELGGPVKFITGTCEFIGVDMGLASKALFALDITG
jgi:hypothetical protein